MKIKPKAEPRAARPQPVPAQVVQGVAPDNGANEIEPPTEEATRILVQLNAAKEKLLQGMKDFGTILRNNTLPNNKSIEEKRTEQAVVIDLMRAAETVETLSPREGILGVAIFAVRQSLSLRDAGNRIAYELHKLQQRVEKLEKEESDGKEG